jgi:outer membrane receptor protein involved in Fe transport
LSCAVAASAADSPDQKDENQATSETAIFSAEITVEAQKREQEIQEVPISTTFLSKEMLRDFDIYSAVRMEQKIPNLRINFNRNGGANSTYEIRGVGHLTDGDEIVSQPVTIHLNQVPSPFNVTTEGLIFDMERVEVLRGPQGDLFGLNTTGGTINYISARPTETLQAGVYVEAGNYDSSRFESFVSGPLAGRWSGRLAVSNRRLRDGWQTNAETGERYGEIDLGGARFSTRFAGDSLLADIEIHYGWNKSDPVLGRLMSPLTTVLGEYVEPVEGWADVGWSEKPAYGTTENRPFTDSREAGMTANVDWNIGSLTLHSITGIQDFDREGWFDGDGSRVKEVDWVRDTNVRSFSQEFRIDSPATRSLYWMAGIYGGTDTVENLFFFDVRASKIFPAVVGNDTEQERDALAVFGRAEWAFNRRWQLDVGLRYSREKRSIVIDGTQLLADPLGLFAGVYEPGDILTDSVTNCLTIGDCTPGEPYADSIDDGDWSGKINLLFAPNDPWRFYLSLSRGFKSGGFNDNSTSSTLQYLAVRPERLYAYELGAKGRLSGGALHWNSAVFYYDFKDQQVEDFIVDPVFGPLEANTNAPNSELYGFESELLWQITSRLAVTHGLGFTDGRFKDFQGIDALAVSAQDKNPDFQFFTPVYLDRTDGAIGFPNWQYNGMIQYQLPLARERWLRFAIDYSYESEARQAGEFERVLPAFWLFNARVAYRLSESLEVGLWGRNLTDTRYLNDWQNWFDAEVQVVGMPRTFGVSLRWAY